jgi:Flp pilus assembly protein TadD
VSVDEGQEPSEVELVRLFESYQAGRYDEAEMSALSITQQYPNHQFGWKVLAVVLKISGRMPEALAAVQKAVELDPEDAEAHNNLGNMLRELGRLNEAEASCRNAIALQPDFAEAHNNLGVTLHQCGKLEAAEACYRQAIALKPNHAQAHYNLGVTLQALGRLKEAEGHYRRAIALKGDYPEAYCNLANTLRELGSLEEAEASHRKSIVLAPGYAEVYSNFGVTLQERGKLEEAEANYGKAIALKGDTPEFHCNLGNTLRELGRLKDAEASYRKAIALKPDFADAYWNLSGVAKTISEAEHWIDQCLTTDADYVNAKLTKAALRYYQGDRAGFDDLMQSEFQHHPYMRSFAWAFGLPKLPDLYFDRWSFFDAVVEHSVRARPFYEFGVWRGASFRYFIRSFKNGYGFDTFSGLPENWDVGNGIERAGTYSSDGIVPQIDGGEFIVGKFEDTLPSFFAEARPLASVMNFDADLYSSTLCALNCSKPAMDKDTILVFDEFLIHDRWEQDEFRALNEFASNNNYTYEVLALSFFTKQVAVRLIGI